MHKYETLYRRWKRYRLKKVAIKSLLATSLLALAGVGYYFYFFLKEAPKPQKIKKDNIILPNKDFEKHLFAYRMKQKRKQKQKQKAAPVSKKEPKQKLLIHSQNTSIQELIKAFNTKPSAQKALIIAKRYFNEGNFKNAAKWAYRANTLDQKNEESWLLFAKSLAKDGKRKKALSVLNIYYKKSRSQKAKLLLEQIAKGEFQ